MSYRIMIIEDDASIREELSLLLSGLSYQVTVPNRFTDLADQVLHAAPDLVLLDLELPNENGLTVCSRIRQSSSVPIIFVTGHHTSMDELNCLLRGGDDFIAKPYQPALLLAHISAVLRRSCKEPSKQLVYHDIVLDLASGTISRASNAPASENTAAASSDPTVHAPTAENTAAAASNPTVHAPAAECLLSRNEVKILFFLMEHAGSIVSRESLMDYLWQEQVYIDDNTLSVNMTRLRSKLASIGAPDYITTRRGMGYQL